MSERLRPTIDDIRNDTHPAYRMRMRLIGASLEKLRQVDPELSGAIEETLEADSSVAGIYNNVFITPSQQPEDKGIALTLTDLANTPNYRNKYGGRGMLGITAHDWVKGSGGRDDLTAVAGRLRLTEDGQLLTGGTELRYTALDQPGTELEGKIIEHTPEGIRRNVKEVDPLGGDTFKIRNFTIGVAHQIAQQSRTSPAANISEANAA